MNWEVHMRHLGCVPKYDCFKEKILCDCFELHAWKTKNRQTMLFQPWVFGKQTFGGEMNEMSLSLQKTNDCKYLFPMIKFKREREN